jgi:hypothetical protein
MNKRKEAAQRRANDKKDLLYVKVRKRIKELIREGKIRMPRK